MSQSVKARISSLTAEGRSLVQQAGRLGVQIGLNFAAVDALITEHGSKAGYESIRAYLETEYPDLCTPFYGSSEAYRNLQAGRVAVIIGEVGDVSVNALTPLHKLVNDPPTLLAVWKAAKGRKASAPTKAAIDAAMPEGLTTPGPRKGSAKAANGAKAKAAKAGTTKTAPKAAPAESREVIVREVPQVTESATKAAQLRLSKVIAAVDEESVSNVLVVMQAVAKACDDIGSANVLAALHVIGESVKVPAAKAARRRNTRSTAAKAAK